MGCINVQATSLKTNINVKANSNDKCIIKINNLLHSIVKINGIQDNSTKNGLILIFQRRENGYRFFFSKFSFKFNY